MNDHAGHERYQTGKCATCARAKAKRYDDTHKEERRRRESGKRPERAAQARARRLALKLETIAAYGGSCTCCRETNPGFLTLDHVNNDGGGPGRSEAGYRLYARLRREGWPKGDLVLMCFNCNSGRAQNGGVCPHLRALTAAQFTALL